LSTTAAHRRALLDLPPGQVDLWLARTDPVEPVLAARWRAVMTADEAAQHARFLFAKDRHRYLVTRALVRDVLSRYAAVEPHAWRFRSDAWGKPHVVDPPAPVDRFAFNITHTDGLVAVGVTRDRALGIDAECMRRDAPVAIAERYFSAAESRALRRLPAAAQALRFWELWTLKESYIKARGLGLSIPLDRFGFDLDGPGAVALSFAPGFDDVAGRWRFVQLRPSADHLLAVCIERGDDDALPRLCVREAVPLVASEIVRCAPERGVAEVTSGTSLRPSAR
jgi:4'-phosphopantetheinyl transferase